MHAPRLPRFDRFRFAVDWVVRAALIDRITMIGVAVLVGGIAIAWGGPVLFIVATGQWMALPFAPFMSLSLTFFFVLPPLLFLLPRLFVWDARVSADGREIDLTKFAHPADLAKAKVDEIAGWNGTTMLLKAKGQPFIGRTLAPAVRDSSYYRAMHKADLQEYAQGKPHRWKDVELGLLAVMILGGLFIGLLAAAE